MAMSGLPATSLPRTMLSKVSLSGFGPRTQIRIGSLWFLNAADGQSTNLAKLSGVSSSRVSDRTSGARVHRSAFNDTGFVRLRRMQFTRRSNTTPPVLIVRVDVRTLKGGLTMPI